MTCTLACQNCETLKKRIKELEATLTQKDKEITDLKRKLLLHENAHTPSSKRMYPTRTGDHTKCIKRFPGRPKGHIGITRPKPKPDITKAPEKKCTCDHCGAPLDESTHVEHHVFEEIANPKPRQVIDYLEFEYKCVTCNSYTSTRHPDCPPDGVFGKNILIQTTLMKFEQRLPFEKISQQLESQFGFPMTAASAFDVTRRVCDYLRPEYDAIVEQIRTAKIVYIDETGEKVDGKKHWLWVFTTKTHTLFVISKSRGKNVLEQVLGEDFSGTCWL